jgi:TRAP-type C4-dicarboxylate transport system substrate-binding protein
MPPCSSGHEHPIFGVDAVPFLATSYDEARKLWAASKPTIARNLEAQGLIVLFAVPWPPQGIFANQEINQIGDLKGLSWRVYNASTRRIAQMVEAHPVCSWREIRISPICTCPIRTALLIAGAGSSDALG